MPQAIGLADNKDNIARCYPQSFRKELPVYSGEDVRRDPSLCADTRYIFSTWSMPAFSREEIKTLFPQLRAVLYGAGSVQGFAQPFLEEGVRVFSAWGANAVPVAEFTVAQILLANKGYFQLHARYAQGHADAVAYAETFPGNFDTKVGLLGAGMIGRGVIERLRWARLCLLVFDPFLSDADATALGVTKADLPTIFSQCQTISNHLANNEQTRGMLGYDLFSRMLPNATFLNTGRGAQVVHEGLVRALREEPGRTALLDVTDPTEPLPQDHPLWGCPNAFLTPHRAGSAREEILRMGEYMIEQYENLLAGRPTQYEVTLDMLHTMA